MTNPTPSTPPPAGSANAPALAERVERLEKRLADLEAYARSMHEWIEASRAAKAKEEAARAVAPAASPGVAQPAPTSTHVQQAPLAAPAAAAASIFSPTHPPVAHTPATPAAATQPPAAPAPAPQPASSQLLAARREAEAARHHAQPSAAVSTDAPAPVAPPPVTATAPPLAKSSAPAQFLDEAEFHKGLAAATEGRESRPPVGLETILQYVGLVAGGLFLVVAAAAVAILAPGPMAPLIRVAMGLLVGGALGMTGAWMRRKQPAAGALTFAIGLSVAYLTTFAAGFTEAMGLVPHPVSLVGMTALMAILVVMSERWRSEPMAALGLLLGVLGALLVAQTSAGYALLSLVVLAAAAGVLLVRNEWARMTALVLVTTYLATAILWALVRVDSAGEVIAHLGALAAYHLVFTAAFWKWGRKWVAREMAAMDAPATFGTPEIKLGAAPFSTAFALLNSLAFSSLSVLLLWLTGTWWGQAHWLLGAIALMEAARLFIPALRRGQLPTFHALHAFALASAAAISAFAGLTEAAVLAAMTLAVAIAATRAPMLRWLRPVGAFTAFLVIPSYQGFTITGLWGFVAGAAPGLLLLASALPWHRIGTRDLRLSRALSVIEFLSASFRAFVATGVLIMGIEEAPASEPVKFVLVCVMATITVGGLVLLSAHAWLAAATLATILALAATIGLLDGAGLQFVALVAVLLAASVGWTCAAERAPGKLLRSLHVLAQVGLGCLAALFFVAGLEGELDGWLGLAVALAAIASTAVSTASRRLVDSTPSGFEGGWALVESRARLGVFAGGLLMAAGLFMAPVIDAQDNTSSPLLLAAGLLGVWWVARAKARATVVTELMPALAILVATTGLLVGVPKPSVGLLFLAVAGIVALEGTRRSGSRGLFGAALGVLALYSPLALATWFLRGLGAWEAAAVIAACMALGGWSYRVAGAEPPSEEGPTPGLSRAPMALVPLLSFAVLWLCTTHGLLPGLLVTGAWSALAFVLFGVGIVARRAELRFTAFGVFAAAGGRLILHDLAGRDWFTIAVAFGIVGALLVAAMVGSFVLMPKDKRGGE